MRFKKHIAVNKVWVARILPLVKIIFCVLIFYWIFLFAPAVVGVIGRVLSMAIDVTGHSGFQEICVVRLSLRILDAPFFASMGNMDPHYNSGMLDVICNI